VKITLTATGTHQSLFNTSVVYSNYKNKLYSKVCTIMVTCAKCSIINVTKYCC